MNTHLDISTPIYFEHYNKLIELSGGIEQATFLSKIIFQMQNTKIYIQGKTWIVQTRDALALWSHTNTKKVDRILKDLEKSSLIEKKILKFKGVPKLHISLQEKALMFIRNNFNSNLKKKAADSLTNNAKTPDDSMLQNQDNRKSQNGNIHIKGTKVKETKNNNTKNEGISTNKPHSQVEENNVIFSSEKELNVKDSSLIDMDDIDYIADKLTLSQLAYLKKTIQNLKTEHNCKFSNEQQFLEEAEFTILDKTQLKGITSFKHKVNIISKHVRNKSWSTPIGFKTYSTAGKIRKQSELKQAEKLKELKVQEKQQSKAVFNKLKQGISTLFSYPETNLKQLPKNKKEPVQNTDLNNKKCADVSSRVDVLSERIERYKQKAKLLVNTVDVQLIIDMIKRDETELFELSRSFVV